MIRPVNVRGCRGRKEQPAVEAVPGERLIVANRVAARQGTFGAVRLWLAKWLLPRGYAIWTWNGEYCDYPIVEKDRP